MSNPAKRYQFIGEDKRLMPKAHYTLVEAATAVGLHQKTMFSRMQTKLDKVITDHDLRPTEGFFGGAYRGSRTYASRFSNDTEKLSAKWLKRRLVVTEQSLSN